MEGCWCEGWFRGVGVRKLRDGGQGLQSKKKKEERSSVSLCSMEKNKSDCWIMCHLHRV